MVIDAAFLQSWMPGGNVGLGLGIAFFLVLAVIAYVVFRLLKKTVKMAVRLAVVVAILLIAALGAVSIYWFGHGARAPQRPPAPTRSR